MEHEGAALAGPTFVTLWECGDSVTGVRERDGRLEFLKFGIEDPDHFVIVAYSPKGLLANVFFDLVEDADWRDESKAITTLREAAAAVGFDRLGEVLALQEKGDYEARLRYTQSL